MLYVSRVGTEFRVNTEVAFDQRFSTITGLANGGFVVTWSFRSDNVKAQLYSSSGAKIGNEFLVNTTTFGGQTAASVAKLAGGGFVVSWADDGGTLGIAGDDTVRTQIYTGAGVRVGTETVANTAPIGNLTSLAVGDLANGGYVVGWTDASTASAKAQIFTATGTRVSTEFLIDSPNVQFLAISGLSNGNFVVASQDFTSRTLVAQIFDPLGARIGAELSVTATTAFLFEPAITSLSNGGFVVSWADSNPTLGDASGTGVKLQVFAADGTKVSAETLVNTQTANSQQAPTITSLSTGNFVVSWTDNSLTLGDASGASIKLQAFNNAGVKIGSELLVNTQVVNNQVEPAVTGLPDGRFVVSWTDNDPSGDGSASSIKAQIFELIDGGRPAITSNGGGATAVVSVGEGPTAVTLVTATDPDPDDVVGFSIVGGADQALFTIDSMGGLLAFAGPRNFEVPGDAGGNNVYDVIVRASDGALFDEQAIAVTVTDANETPAITSNAGGATAAISVLENTIAVTTVTAIDPDAGAIVSFAIAGGADAARFQIDSVSGALRFTVAPDLEVPLDVGGDNVYDVVVRASDGSLFDEQAIAVTVTGNNEAPVIVSNGGAATVALNRSENATLVTTVLATDPNATDIVTYSIAGGADAARFVIDGLTGAIDFVTAPDFEVPTDFGANNNFDVVVRASDGRLFDDQALAVRIADVNEAPVIRLNASGAPVGISIFEGTTAVTNIPAFDPDAFAAVDLSITGGADAARFAIDGTTGALRFLAAPDFEAPADAGGDNVYDVIVRASDGSLIDDQAIAVTVLSGAGNATAVKIGNEFLVNTSVENEQSLPSVTKLSNGGFVIGWIDQGTNPGDGDGSSIKAQLYDTNGQRVGTEIILNTETANNQVEPRFAQLAGGGFVVSWYDLIGPYFGPNERDGAKAQIFDNNGGKVGGEFFLNTETTGSQIFPRVAGLADGGFVATWEDSGGTLGDADGTSIKGQVFDATGTKLGGEFLANTVTAENQLRPVVAGLADGGFVITWGETDGNFRDGTVAQIFDATGVKVGSQFAVNALTEGGQLRPTVAALTGGGFVVSWSGFLLGDSDSFGVHAQIFAANGATIGPEFLVNTATAGSQSLSEVSGLADGGFVVTWTDESGTLGDASGPSIKAQAFSAVGARTGGEFLVNTQTQFLQLFPSISGLENGGFVITWQDSTSAALGDPDRGGIKAQIFGLNRAPSDLILAGNVIPENAPAGTVVGTVTGVDPGDTLIYTLVNDAGGRFVLDAVTGLLTVAASADLDFEVSPSLDIVARVTDAAGQAYDERLTIQLIDVIEGVTDASYVGTNSANSFSATPGSLWTLSGLGGADTLTGAEGDDTLIGGQGNDSLTGLSGDDVFLVGAGDNMDSFDGGTEFDTIRTTAAGVVIGVTAITGIERVEGIGAIIAGTAAADALDFSATALVGVTEIRGNNGADTITGSAGGDTVRGGAGIDFVAGGDGDDVFLVGAGDNQDSYDGGADFDSIRTIAPGVTIGIAALAKIERIEGVDAIIAGTAVADGLDFSGVMLIGIAEIRGNNGADTITGSADADTILGGASNDVIDGGGGDDLLAGGAGIDVLTGGAGADIFAGLAYQLRGDSIVDFGSSDAIEISNFADAAAVILSYDGAQLFIDGDGPGGRLPIAVIIGAGYANASFSAASNGVGGTLVTFEIV